MSTNEVTAGSLPFDVKKQLMIGLRQELGVSGEKGCALTNEQIDTLCEDSSDYGAKAMGIRQAYKACI
jgi:hypothetical protein